MDALTQLLVEAPMWLQLPLVLLVLVPALSFAAWGLLKLIDATAKGKDD